MEKKADSAGYDKLIVYADNLYRLQLSFQHDTSSFVAVVGGGACIGCFGAMGTGWGLVKWFWDLTLKNLIQQIHT